MTENSSIKKEAAEHFIYLFIFWSQKKQLKDSEMVPLGKWAFTGKVGCILSRGRQILF